MDHGSSPLPELEQYRFLIALDDALRPLLEPQEITRTAADILGRYLGVNRCAYAHVEDRADSFTLTGDYNRGVPSIVGRYRISDFGEEFVRLSREGKPYVVEDAESDSRVRDVLDAYRQTQIRAVVSVPVVKSGIFVAGMAIHQTTPRQWQDHEIRLLSMVAHRCWESIERNRIALELRDNEVRYRTLIESISSIVWHTDANGAMSRSDPSWEAFTGQTFDEYKGWGWRDAVHPEDRKRLSPVWENIATGRRPAELTYRLRRKDGEYRTVLSRAASIVADDGSIKEWVGTCTDITESRRSAQQFAETKERLETALIAGEVATWVWNIAENRVYADKNLAEIFGVHNGDREPMPVEWYLASVHPDDRQRVDAIIAAAIDGHSDTFRAEYRILQQGGGVRTLLARGVIERGPDGRATRMPGVILDVTERAQAEQALRESEERLRHLANTIPQMAWIANADGYIYWYNDRWYEYTGTTLDQMEGWGWQSVHDPEILPEVKRRWDATLLNAEPFEMVMPLRGADGRFRRFYTLVSPLRDARGNIVQWFGTNTDVTEMEEAERAVRESEERLREGLTAARMAVWDWDIVTGEVKFTANSDAAFGHIWATEEEGWNTVHPADRERLRAAIDAAIAERGQYEIAVRMVRPTDKEVFWVEVRGTVQCDKAGKPVSVRGVFLDITPRKRAEEALREEHRRKDEFLAMLAHELRNPLSPISAAAHLLPMIGKDEKRLLQTTQIISRQIEHITKLVDDLIDVSRVNRGLVTIDKQPLDLRVVVREAVDQVTPLIDAQHHRLTLQVPPEAARVQGDKTRLIQVVTNLLSNAARYTPQGGDIALAIDVGPEQIELRVRDNGIGLPPDLLPHVFELFVQGQRTPDRSQGGLGLGLALVKNLVGLHDGSVLARSEGSGKGSEFIVRLPRAAEPVDKPQIEDDPALLNVLPDALRILVVDDNIDAAQTLAMLLEVHGHRTWVEYDATSALKRADNQAFQVLILDIGLPDMDGYELARRMRTNANTADAVFVALSGYGQTQDREKSKAAGFNHHLVKPVDIDRLSEVLAKASSANKVNQ